MGEKDNTFHFINLDILSLRCSSRIRAKDTGTIVHSLLVLTISTFTAISVPITDYPAKTNQSRVIRYDDFLDYNFDGIANHTSPLVQIYLLSQSNNEMYTLNNMLKEPDTDKFGKAI